MTKFLTASLVVAAFLLAAGRGNADQQYAYDSLRASYRKMWKSEIGEAYAKKEKDALMDYWKSLDALLATYKQKGDAKTYGVVDAEKKRFSTEGTTPDAKTADPVFAEAMRAFQKNIDDARAEQSRQTVALLKDYLAALDTLFKDLTQAAKHQEAKAVLAERDKMAAKITYYESTVPKNPRPVHATPVKPMKMVIPSAAKTFKWHHYLFVTAKKTWHEAKKACEEMGGHLVTITNKEENDFAFSLTNGKNAWIGCTDEEKEGKWTWVTGEAFSYKNWADGQPDNADQDPFGFFWEKTPSRWGDVSDRYFGPLSYICEWEH